jgi:Fe-S-cluster containining protein
MMDRATRRLIKLRARIPDMDCPKGCHDCCSGCLLLADDGCSVYFDRPLICKLFGTIENAGFLKCPHGRLPENPLTPDEAFEIMNEYNEISNAGK